MILVDTGPLVALLDRNDPNHARCHAIAQNALASPMLTTLPCLTEAMYFVAKEGGHPPAQQRLWALQERGTLMVHPWSVPDMERMKTLMEKYRDAPMDFADASLVAAAEAVGVARVFTLDSHFYVYLIHDKTPFAVPS